MRQIKEILLSLTRLVVLLALSALTVATTSDDVYGNGLNQVIGIVKADGQITKGTGFTVEHPYVGHYFIHFNTPYVDEDSPVCIITTSSVDPLASCTGGAGTINMDVYCQEFSIVLDPRTGYYDLSTFSSSDLPFSFLCLR